jgi:hypothetical protein
MRRTLLLLLLLVVEVWPGGDMNGCEFCLAGGT